MSLNGFSLLLYRCVFVHVFTSPVVIGIVIFRPLSDQQVVVLLLICLTQYKYFTFE